MFIETRQGRNGKKNEETETAIVWFFFLLYTSKVLRFISLNLVFFFSLFVSVSFRRQSKTLVSLQTKHFSLCLVKKSPVEFVVLEEQLHQQC
jgi:hypothetical protein